MHMTGSAGQRRVPAAYLENHIIGLPPIKAQNRFAAFVQQADKTKFVLQKGLEKLELCYKALLQQYFG
jgi:type I restriction enzyme S subunit